MVPDGADDLLGPLLQRVEQAQAAQRAGTVRLPFEFMAMEALLVTVLPRAARARDRPGTGCGGSSLPHGACQKLCGPAGARDSQRRPSLRMQGLERPPHTRRDALLGPARTRGREMQSGWRTSP